MHAPRVAFPSRDHEGVSMARGGPPKPMKTRNGVYVESTIWTASSTERLFELDLLALTL